jgi:hypothetical protein
MGLDVEWVARRMRAECGFGSLEVPGALEFATRMLGSDSVYAVDPREVWGDGEATTSGLIMVRNDLDPQRRDFVILHECAEIWIARNGVRYKSFLDKERDCDAIAGALHAPADAFVAALLDVGEDLPALAYEFSSTQTAMAFRVGEVTMKPVRVEQPGLVRTRGAPFEAWHRARRVDITDAPQRWALLGA